MPKTVYAYVCMCANIVCIVYVCVHVGIAYCMCMCVCTYLEVCTTSLEDSRRNFCQVDQETHRNCLPWVTIWRFTMHVKHFLKCFKGICARVVTVTRFFKQKFRNNLSVSSLGSVCINFSLSKYWTIQILKHLKMKHAFIYIDLKRCPQYIAKWRKASEPKKYGVIQYSWEKNLSA